MAATVRKINRKPVTFVVGSSSKILFLNFIKICTTVRPQVRIKLTYKHRDKISNSQYKEDFTFLGEIMTPLTSLRFHQSYSLVPVTNIDFRPAA